MEFAVLGAADVSGANFSGANMKRCNLVGTKGHGAILNGVDLYYSRPGNADFENATFVGANVERAIFRRANLANADMSETTGKANFENANLEGMKQ